MFGPVESAKSTVCRRARQCVVGPPKPETVELYEPFQNREPTHCHLGARVFEEPPHNKTPDIC